METKDGLYIGLIGENFFVGEYYEIKKECECGGCDSSKEFLKNCLVMAFQEGQNGETEIHPVNPLPFDVNLHNKMIDIEKDKFVFSIKLHKETEHGKLLIDLYNKNVDKILGVDKNDEE